MSDELDKSFVSKMIYFAVIVVFGLIVWVVVNNLVLSPDVKPSPDYSNLTRMPIDPELETTSIELMSDRRGFTQEELADFPVYIDDSDVTNYNTDGMVVRQLTPRVPYDFSFALLQATGSGFLGEQIGFDL